MGETEAGCPDLDSPSLEDDLTARGTPTGQAVAAAPGATNRTDAALLRLSRIMVAATIRAGNDQQPPLTPTQIRALTLLAAAPNGLSLSAVASCLGSTTSAASRVCSRLVADRLVARSGGPGNEIRLSLAGSGEQLLAAVNRDRLRRLRTLLDKLSPTDCQRVLAAAEILAAATTAGPASGPDTADADKADAGSRDMFW